jgi:CNT family concentrative nucleoside transporter
MHQLAGLLGIPVFLALGWAVSTDRRAVRWRVVAWGLGLQFAFALLILKTPPGYALFQGVSAVFSKLIEFTDAGAGFVWGWMYRKDQPPAFLVDVLMTIVFFSALSSILFHFGVLQAAVAVIAKAMRRTLGTSGSETLSAAANIFVGQTEAPLLVKPYLDTMTRSELHALMTGGFATIAGGVLAAYVSFGLDAGHLVAASFMSAPAALAVSKLFLPETETSVTAGEIRLSPARETVNVFDAACGGAAQGMKLVLNVAAMILAFVSLIALLNGILGWIHGLLAPGVADPVTLQRLFGFLLAPVAWLLGVPWADCPAIGSMLGTRLVINEFVAYLELMQSEVSARAYVVASYAFCGFANLGSIAVQIGGISTMAPSRRADLARIGLRAMFAATLASFLTASVAGALLGDEEVERDYRRNRARVARDAEGRRRECDAFLGKFPDSRFAGEFRLLKDGAR